MNIDETLQQMKAPHVLEAAIFSLPQVLRVDDVQQGVDRLLVEAGLSDEARTRIDALIQRASAEDSDEAVELMRMVMAAASNEGLIGNDAMEEALDAAGRKQLVISPDIYHLGLLLVAGYIAFVSKGRKSSNSKIVIEEQKNGKKKITIEQKDIYIDPFSPLLKMIQLLIKGDAADAEEDAESADDDKV